MTVVVADVNTIWRRKPFEALGILRPVLGLAPMDPLAAWHAGGAEPETGTTAFRRRPVLMLPSWASRMSKLEQRRLWWLTMRGLARQGESADWVVVTSPHYLPFVRALPPGVRTAYYASDDYRAYAGWDPQAMARLERAIVKHVNLALFVSRALAHRAAEELPDAKAKIHVSMNATEPRFFPDDATRPGPVPEGMVLRRPIAGVIGAMNESLDFELLRRCADLPEIGTLLLVGGAGSDAALTDLGRHPKVVWVGAKPHHALPAWFHCLDVALIPYGTLPLNRYRSPMRLFDHLASGAPIVATAACEQVAEFGDSITIVTGADGFVQAVRGTVTTAARGADRQRRSGRARAHTWEVRARVLNRLLPPAH